MEVALQPINHFINNPIVPRINDFAADNTQDRVSVGGTQAFDSLFKAAVNLMNETSQHQFNAEMAQINFATGQDDNILNVLMAQDRAFSTLNFTVQVTNKIIEAYREIMRMQV